MAGRDQTLTTDSTGSEIVWQRNEGWVDIVFAAGTGTLTLKGRDPVNGPAATYHTLKYADGTNVALTATGVVKLDLPLGYIVVPVLSGSGGSPSIIVSPKWKQP